jgi:hypothetical protein
VPIGLFICDAKGNLLRYNKAAVEMWKTAPALGNCEIGDHASFTLFHPDGGELNASQLPLAEVLREGTEIARRELVVQRNDGSRFLARFDAQALRNTAGAVNGVVVAFAEIHGRSVRNCAHQDDARARDFSAGSEEPRNRSLAQG